MPEHPRTHKNGYVFEHILMAEQALGKPLPKGAEIHHHGARDNNSQIVICQDHAYHMLLHRRMRALKACDHANWRKCAFCKQHDKPENLYISPNDGLVFHRTCHNKYELKRRVQNGTISEDTDSLQEGPKNEL